MSLPPLLPIETIRERLRLIFPEGIPAREHILKPITARVVFCALYVGAIASGPDPATDPDVHWLAPRHVYRMRDAIAAASDEVTRSSYYRRVPKSSDQSWYADNSREAGRDEGVRQGLIPLNAMIKRTDVLDFSMSGRARTTPSPPASVVEVLAG